MWFDVPAQRQIEGALHDAHWGEALRMYDLSGQIQTEVRVEETLLTFTLGSRQ